MHLDINEDSVGYHLSEQHHSSIGPLLLVNNLNPSIAHFKLLIWLPV